jgi:hypothetical protein
MVLHDLIADSCKILRLLYGDTASQVEQRIRQRLQDHFIPTAYESDAVAFLKIQ